MNLKILARPVRKVCGYPDGIEEMEKVFFPYDTDLGDQRTDQRRIQRRCITPLIKKFVPYFAEIHLWFTFREPIVPNRLTTRDRLRRDVQQLISCLNFCKPTSGYKLCPGADWTQVSTASAP